MAGEEAPHHAAQTLALFGDALVPASPEVFRDLQQLRHLPVAPRVAGHHKAALMPAANAEAMNEHLIEISTQVTPDAHAILVCDGAGWHQTGGRLKVPDNITPLHPPPYAPELNCLENVWEYLRGNKLSRLVWDSYEAIAAACKEAWDFLINDPDRIRSIGHRDWTCVNVQAGWY